MNEGGTSSIAFSPEELERVGRVDRLSAQGEPGLPQLLAMLDDPSWTVRRTVVAALAAMGKAALEPLVQTLQSRRDSETRIAATVDALAALTGNGGENDLALAAMTAKAETAVLADVAQILGRRRTTAGLPTLVSLTRHADDNVAVAAIEALGRVGGRAAVDSLVESVQSGNFFRAFPAIDVLGRSGDPRAVEPLAGLLELPQYATEAIRALGRTGDAAAAPPLVGLLARPAANVRLVAQALHELYLRLLERFGNGEAVTEAFKRSGGHAGLVRRLTAALAESDAAEQIALAFVLGVIGDPSAAQPLTGLLDRAPEVAEAASAALRRLGPDVELEIVQQLRTGDSARRRALLPFVSRAAAVREVTACLGDPDPEVRALACDALARIGVPAAVGAIFPLLEDANPRVAYAAVAAIQSLGSRETERLAVAAARSSNATVRRAALRILAYFGAPNTVDVLLGALRDPDERVRESAAQGLPFMDDPRALEALFSMAKDPSARTRAAAFRSLGRSSDDLRVTAHLLKGLGDEDAWVRYYACQALGRLAFEPAAQPLIRLLSDPAGQVRVAAVEALSALKSEAAVEALKAAARDEDGDIRRAAIIGLGVSRRTDALPFMLEAAQSSDPTTRLVAVSAFAGFKAPEVLSALERAAADPDEKVSTAALGFLAVSPGARATAALVGLLSRPGRDVPTERVLAALATHADGRVPGLASALETADDETAAVLTSALARLRRPNATDALLAAMRSPNVAARKAAASALAALGGKDAAAALKDAADRDPAPEVRQICSLLLAR